MNENLLDVLLFVFENYMYDDGEVVPDRDSLQVQLLEAGFPLSLIHRALDWLEGLDQHRVQLLASGRIAAPVRVFGDGEARRLDAECRGFLMHLEQVGVLDGASRELVLDRVMALEEHEIVDLEDLKWLILMVLFHQPGQEAACAWMENLLFEPTAEQPH